MSAQPADRSPRVVRIVSVEDAPADESWGHGLPGFWLLLALFVFAILFFVGLQVPLMWVRP